MTRRITIASQKGGVGKTTVTINLGYSLRRLGTKVLIVDADPQGGVATACKSTGIEKKGLVQVLRGEISLDQAVVPLKGHQLSMLGTGMSKPEDLIYFEEQVAANRLSELFASWSSDFDFVLFDAPVGVGSVTRELLSVSDSLLQVINCRAGTVKTISKLLNLYVWIRKNRNPALKLEGILFNMMTEASKIEERISKQLISRLPARLFFNTRIPSDPIFEIASLKGVPLEELSAGRAIGKNFMELAIEVDTKKHQDVGDMLSGDEYEIASEDDPGDGIPDGTAVKHVDKIKEALEELCISGGFYGAVVADVMGFSLADYHSPLDVDSLATYSSLLGEALAKAGSIIDMPEANNLIMDINSTDKMLLHRFSILDDQYSLVAVCPQEVEAIGEVSLAATRIAGALS